MCIFNIIQQYLPCFDVLKVEKIISAVQVLLKSWALYSHQDWNPILFLSLSSAFFFFSFSPIWASYLTSSSFTFFSYKIIKMIHMTLCCEEKWNQVLTIVLGTWYIIITIFSKFTVNVQLSFGSLSLERTLAQFSNQVWPSLTSHISQPVKFPYFDQVHCCDT